MTPYCEKCGEPIGYLGKILDTATFGAFQKVAHPHNERDKRQAKIGLGLCMIAAFTFLIFA